MFLIKNNRAFYMVISSFLITCFIFKNNMAIADDWGCEGINGNMHILKINSDSQGLLEGSDCDTQVRSGDGGEQGKRAYVLQATDDAMLMSFYLDISDSVIGEDTVIDFMQLESGSGYDQALLLDLRLTQSGGDMLLLIDWYQPSSSPSGIALVQAEVINISDNVINDVATVNFGWDNGMASLSVVESGATSVLADSHLYSPRILQVGVIGQNGISVPGKLYRIYDTEINLVN